MEIKCIDHLCHWSYALIKVKLKVFLPGLLWKKINQHSLKKWSVLCFFIYHYLLYKPELYWSKRHKKPLNNKPIKTITEHLIEITNHKMHGVQNTHSEVSLNGTQESPLSCIIDSIYDNSCYIIIYRFFLLYHLSMISTVSQCSPICAQLYW